MSSPEPELDHNTIHEAAKSLVNGELVAFPTETVYGLGADAENEAAVRAIYAAKGRPANHPVIVHVAPGADLYYWAAHIPAQAWRLIERFWPGPLTLILPRASHIPDQVSGGQDSIGLRCPSHPVAQALLTEFARLKGGNAGVAAPSANRFGRISPTQAAHVRAEFKQLLAENSLTVLDGGSSQVGIESTIVDLSRRDDQGQTLITVLRPGHITPAQIEEALGISLNGLAQTQAEAPRVSGSLKAHYAPTTPLYLIDTAQLKDLLPQLSTKRVALLAFGEAPIELTAQTVWRRLSDDPVQYAHQLYAILRDADQQGFDALYIQRPPTDARWEAVNDRIRRAAAAFED